MRNKTQQRFTTPQGTAVWPHLNTPDRKFIGEGDPGVFKTDLRVPQEDCRELLEQMESVRDQWCEQEGYTNKAPLPWKDELGPDGAPTGNVLIRFKQKESIRVGSDIVPMRIRLVDAAKNPVDATIGGGSTIRIAFNARGWNATSGYGITLHPTAVQVINLVEASGGANDLGDFDVEEGGFVASDEEGGDGDF